MTGNGRAVWSVNAHPEIKAGMDRLNDEIGQWVNANQPLEGPIYERYARAHRTMGDIAYRLGYNWGQSTIDAR